MTGSSCKLQASGCRLQASLQGKLQAAGHRHQAASHNRLEAAGYKLQATGHTLQATSYRPQATRPLQARGYKPQATSNRLQASGYKLQATSIMFGVFPQDNFQKASSPKVCSHCLIRSLQGNACSLPASLRVRLLCLLGGCSCDIVNGKWGGCRPCSSSWFSNCTQKYPKSQPQDGWMEYSYHIPHPGYIAATAAYRPF